MDLVVNKKTPDGVDNPPGAPAYRVEFQSERLYQNDKITPINAADDDDEIANSKKLIDIGMMHFIFLFYKFYVHPLQNCY